MHYDSQSHTLVVLTLGKVRVYQLAGARLDCDHEIASIEIHSDEKYLGIKSGQVFIQRADKEVRRVLVDSKRIESIH